MTLHCTSVCRRDGWRGERYSELSFTTGKEVCSKNLRVCKRYVYMLQPLDGTSFYEKKEISWNSPKSFKQQGPQSEYRMSQKITLLKFLENKSFVILGNSKRIIFIGTSCTVTPSRLSHIEQRKYAQESFFQMDRRQSELDSRNLMAKCPLAKRDNDPGTEVNITYMAETWMILLISTRLLLNILKLTPPPLAFQPPRFDFFSKIQSIDRVHISQQDAISPSFGEKWKGPLWRCEDKKDS